MNNDKLIKWFTVEEMQAYNHKRYEKDRKHRLDYQKEYYQKEYYQKHKTELQKKGRNYYRKKCGLGKEK